MDEVKEYYIFEVHHEPASQYPWTSATDHYSSELMATAKYHERISAIMKSTSFDKATVLLTASNGVIMKMETFKCSYAAPEPEGE